jgi:bifunctional N-acetylglutamate synthase/kinase
MEPADVVLRFLESVGRRSDAEFYLALFRAEAKEGFAAIHVDASVARHAVDAVVLELGFLRALGLVPVVVLGVFEPAEAATQARRIRRKLEEAGVPATQLPAAAAGAEAVAAVAAACRRGELPILAFGDGEGADTPARFAALGALVGALASRKLIFLSRRGGLRQGGALVPIVNLTTEAEALAASRELSAKQRLLVAQARRLVFELTAHKPTIAVTAPLDLLRELFTVKGAGTLLRRGAVIDRRAGFAEIDADRLRGLLASSFGRPPRDAFFARPVSRIYLEEGYRGAAVVVDTPLGAYLTKFAVERQAQGEGMGRDLWEALAVDYPAVFWRARPDNPIGAWYAKLCDGLMRFPDWHVYWRGLAAERVHEAIAYALAAPIDIPAPGGE